MELDVMVLLMHTCIVQRYLCREGMSMRVTDQSGRLE
jgi:hypothetical protein